MHTLIIGGGWAGLSAAVHLAKKDHSEITLVEAAPQVGGRARSVPFGSQTVDNGQHVLMGAYQHYLTLLDIVGIPESQLLHRCPFQFYNQSLEYPGTRTRALSLVKTLAPFHLLLGLIKAKGFSLHEKIQILRLCQTIKKRNTQASLYVRDISVLDFLKNHHQSQKLIHSFWEPLVLAALTTPIAKASAQVFLKTLETVFTQHQTYSNWLYPKLDLSELLPNPAVRYLEQRGHRVLLNHRIDSLCLNHDRCTGAKSKDHVFNVDNVILATSPKTAYRLMTPIPPLSDICLSLKKMTHQPITTVYIALQEPMINTLPLMGLIGTTGQWIFNRKLSGNPTVLSVIISGEGPHQTLNQETLIQKILDETRAHYGNIHPIAYKVITEKQAAFSCEVDIHKLRPTHLTPLKNLYLAGDYTQTGYPSSLEGAVLSGYNAVRNILT